MGGGCHTWQPHHKPLKALKTQNTAIAVFTAIAVRGDIMTIKMDKAHETLFRLYYGVDWCGNYMYFIQYSDAAPEDDNWTTFAKFDSREAAERYFDSYVLRMKWKTTL